MPSTDEEIWRYSRIAELDLAAYAHGHLRTETVGADAVRVTESLAGIAMVTPPDVFAELNGENADTVSLRIPKGVTLEEAIHIVHHVDADGIVAYPRLVIDAEENSEVTVIETFVSADAIHSLVVPVLEVRTGKAARVNYLAINQLGLNTWQIGHQQSVGHRDSTTRLATVALGGDYARMRTEVRLVEQGASAQQVALYFAGGTQMHDFRTLQIHVPIVTCCLRELCETLPAASTPALFTSSQMRRTHRLSKPTATSHSVKAHGPKACRTLKLKPMK
jgi:Fe-S cluster assembly protein SufD